MSKTYDLDDLIDARLSADRWGRHPKIGHFYVDRHRALASAFRIDLDDQRVRTDDFALDGLIDSCANALGRLTSPFSDFIEAPGVIGEHYRRFGADIQAGLAAARGPIRAALKSALIARHGLDEHATVSDADLLAHGFDPATPWPDEEMYFG